MRYDDHTLSCPGCSRGLEAEDLCEHDNPQCCRCCTLEHSPMMIWRRSA